MAGLNVTDYGIDPDIVSTDDPWEKARRENLSGYANVYNSERDLVSGGERQNEAMRNRQADYLESIGNYEKAEEAREAARDHGLDAEISEAGRIVDGGDSIIETDKAKEARQYADDRDITIEQAIAEGAVYELEDGTWSAYGAYDGDPGDNVIGDGCLTSALMGPIRAIC
ncbi:hypothetical protein [Parasulfitobacter algicola]|uniref:Uncharacterized protein n=1 Tax=Parasulfitobacter algicola TaxID=2614809 RepID=A0ABX2J1A4_9RHOB|nr:hypothetical protein [Sulfitobacter algicola]NSX57028.1 hypothetical protein [Sulfitobacter algicola]